MFFWTGSIFIIYVYAIFLSVTKSRMCLPESKNVIFFFNGIGLDVYMLMYIHRLNISPREINEYSFIAFLECIFLLFQNECCNFHVFAATLWYCEIKIMKSDGKRGIINQIKNNYGEFTILQRELM